MSTDVQVTVVPESPESPESLESPLDLRTCYGQLGRGQTIKLLNASMSIYGIIVQKTDLWTVQQEWEVNIETLYSRYTETLWQYKLPQTCWNTFLNHGLRRLRAQTNLKSLESSKWHWMQSRQHQERCCLQVIKVMSAFWCFLMLSGWTPSWNQVFCHRPFAVCQANELLQLFRQVPWANVQNACRTLVERL